jgi:outer membrane beta-barrel protein
MPPAAPVGEPPRAGVIRDAAPRPTPALRVQSRYVQKSRQTLLFAGAEYLSRGDYFINPGARVGVAYYLLEPLALELQVSHYWSSLNGEAERIKSTFGLVPDSHAPEWLALAGARYSIGYGKLMVGGFGKAIHFEPQAFLHVGGHVYDGDVGFSSDVGLGLAVFLTPRFFSRVDVALVFEREQRSGTGVSVWGALPALTFGGML